jgi:CRISPR-associated endonuclease/helicase Cas3
MEIPSYLTKIYAKSPSRGNETLYEHTWHVMSRFADYVQLRPEVAAQTGNPRLWHQLFWACMLHDFGKVARGFQHMLATDGKDSWPHRHEVASLAFVGWLFPDTESDDYQWVVAAIVSHHKDAKTITENYRGLSSIQSIVAELTTAPLEELWKWIHEYAVQWQTQLGLAEYGIEHPALLPQGQAMAHVRIEGSAHIEKALRIYRQFVAKLENTSENHGLATTSLAVRGITVTADHSASAHSGTPPQLPKLNYQDIIQRLGWPLDGLYEHQCQCAQATNDVLLIAPTGSGKTESALFWAFGTTAKPVPRLFYSLPFQASMNAMHQRLAQLFPEIVSLQHGRAIQALYRIYIEQGEAATFATQHAKQHKNRTELNYFPIRVLSPYQLLKACYRIRGYEAIVSDLFGASFIFDEIHAYEPKRLALILALMAHLKQQYGTKSFFMSATFPELIKGALKHALGHYDEISATPELFQSFQRHRLHMLHGDMTEEQHLDRIMNDARNQQSVLVCCNTVDRAQSMWSKISDQLGEHATVILLHSRLHARDRLEREKQVRLACGVGSADRQPIVLVATQVVEVSLNIDLDTIYSDIAPLEALIQRFGRVNRTRRKSADGTPLIMPVYVFTEPIPEKTMRPYDLRLLHGVLRILAEQDGNSIDESAVSTWLNTIYNDYADTYVDDWQSIFRQQHDEFQQQLHNLVAFNTHPELEELFYSAFESVEVLPQRFEQEYFDLMKSFQFVEADSLMVSIADWQYGMLKRQGKVRPGNYKADDPREKVNIVMTEYDDNLGLRFE